MLSHAPSFDIFGSFFPVWIACIAVAVLVTLAVRLVLLRLRLDAELGPRIIVYPSLVALLACSVWLVFFHY